MSNYFHFQFDQNAYTFLGEYTVDANENLVQASFIGSVKNDESLDMAK